MKNSIQILYASTGGHAREIALELMEALAAIPEGSDVSVTKQAAETAHGKDLLRADVLVLISGAAPDEKHLNASMLTLLYDRSKSIDLTGKPVVCINLSTEPATVNKLSQEMQQFVEKHHGTMLLPPFRLTGSDNYGYEKKIHTIAEKILSHVLRHLKPARVRKSVC